MPEQEFSRIILNWFDAHGRKNLPWQFPRHPYRVWLSEIMLQQTQVKTVIPYFEQFITHFPTIRSLASAPLDSVMALWTGLGYYSRARNLHRTAQIISEEWNGEFPSQMQVLKQLPGIGPTTAAAICAQAFDQPTAILDANVKRVLSRVFMMAERSEKKLWLIAQQCMPMVRCADYTQGIMDFGALCCTAKNPLCTQCPLQQSCLAFKNNCVNDYPPSKKKSIKPIKESNFYLMHQQNKIYLIQNPPNGIWGSLWSLPSGPTSNHRIVKNHLAANTISPNPQFKCTIKHTFSHYHLWLHVWEIAIATAPAVESEGRWFTCNETKDIGLAKPIQQIILEYQQKWADVCESSIEE